MMSAPAVAHKPAVADAYLSAYEQFTQIVTQLRSPQTQHMTHSELEHLLEVEGREVLRRLLQAHLDARCPGTVAEPVVGADGQQRTQQRTHTRHLETVFGEVEVTRQGYGRRGLASLHPLDAELNLPLEHYSHTLRRHVAYTAASQSYDEVVATITTYTGQQVPKRQAEELAQRAAQDFAAFYQAQRAHTARGVAATSNLLIISIDGKGVPMRKDDLRAPTHKAALERQPHLTHRRSKGEKPHTKRMGTVAAVYTMAPFVRTPEEIVRELQPLHEPVPKWPRPEEKRVWASVEQAPPEVIDQAFAEAARRDPKHAKQWVALVDGNPTQLKLVQVAAADYGVELVIILDLIHVLEYLWKAAWVLHGEGDPAAEAWVSTHLKEILRGHSSQVAAGLRRSATVRGLSKEKRKPLDKCADYLLKYREFLHYDQYLAAGLPMATGVIEGACRHLVKDRMELTGARWGLEGAEAVLRLRSLRASGDFEEYWEFHLKQEQQRNHSAHYAGGKVPTPNSELGLKGKGSHLRLVK
jgi:hypothetical protein